MLCGGSNGSKDNLRILGQTFLFFYDVWEIIGFAVDLQRYYHKDWNVMNECTGPSN